MKIVYDATAIQFMNLFERLTGAHLKDCIVEPDMIWFIVQPMEMGKAIGKGGVNKKRLERQVKQKVRIVEFADDTRTFIKHLIFPLEVKEIAEEDGMVSLTPIDFKTRGMLIGRGATTLRKLESIVQRYFPIKELKIV